MESFFFLLFFTLEDMVKIGFYCTGIVWNSFPETTNRLCGLEKANTPSIDIGVKGKWVKFQF